MRACRLIFGLALVLLGLAPGQLSWAQSSSDGGPAQKASETKGTKPAAAAPAPTPGAAAPASQPTAPASQPAGVAKPKWTPEITAQVKPAEAHLGDPITVTITARYRRGISVNLPLKPELGKFHELSRDEKVKESGGKGEIPKVEHTFILKVAAYELGEQVLPAIELTALGPRGELVTVPTAAVPIRVKSLTVNEPQPKLKELEPPVLVYQRTWWFLYLVGGLAAVGLIALATLLISRQIRRRKEAQKPPPPPRPAHEIALERLAAIDVATFVAEERFKELYLLLSEIIRDYLGRRWSFDALESTTSEITASLERCSVPSEVRDRFISYLNDCDLVKFAKYRPAPEGAQEAVQEAEALVRETAAAGTASGAGPGPRPGSGSGPGGTSSPNQEPDPVAEKFQRAGIIQAGQRVAPEEPAQLAGAGPGPGGMSSPNQEPDPVAEKVQRAGVFQAGQRVAPEEPAQLAGAGAGAGAEAASGTEAESRSEDVRNA